MTFELISVPYQRSTPAWTISGPGQAGQFDGWISAFERCGKIGTDLVARGLAGR